MDNRLIRQAAKNILSEQGFDDRLKAAGGFSDEEMDDITSRDVGSPFPGDTSTSPGYDKADELKKQLIQDYRSMSQEEVGEFSKEMALHFIQNDKAKAAVMVKLGKDAGPEKNK